MASLVLPAPAKLNLFLHITGRRPDGYHSLQTLFQFLDFGDELAFEKSDRRELELECNVSSLATDDNLILKAARLLQSHTGCRNRGAKISLTKRLPLGGGIGGGSSNAATALHGLNILWGLGLNDDELASLGLKLGADVPVFVRGRAAFGEGVGEILTPLEPEECWYLVLKPDCRVSTAEMYRHEELTRDTPLIRKCDVQLDWLSGKGRRNDFEPLVRRLYPDVNRCLQLLDDKTRGLSIGKAMMSGSGACVFAPFAGQEQAEAAMATIDSDVEKFIAQGMNRSPLKIAISNK